MSSKNKIIFKFSLKEIAVDFSKCVVLSAEIQT
jgi:hypothetical protein